MLLLIEYQKALGILHEAKKELHRMGIMDKKGSCIERLSVNQINALQNAYAAGISHIKDKRHDRVD